MSDLQLERSQNLAIALPNRRRILACAAALAGTPAWGLAQELGESELDGSEFSAEAQAAAEQALEFLARRQQLNGAMGDGPNARNAAVCALAGVAWLAGGHLPQRGRFGGCVERAVDFLLAAREPSGFITVPDSAGHGPMYGHGFATLLLAEAYGSIDRPELRSAVRRAVDLIIETQNDNGGWRYQPIKSEADISVTVCQIMALRAARNAGFFVPSQTADRCIDYVRRCQNEDGGFMYMLSGGPSAFPRSAAGLASLHSAGVYDGAEIEAARRYLLEFRPGATNKPIEYFFYGHYYAALAAWQAGGSVWREWYPAIRDELLSRRDANTGSWRDDVGSEYATAMAAIVLLTPRGLLPIFRR